MRKKINARKDDPKNLINTVEKLIKTEMLIKWELWLNKEKIKQNDHVQNIRFFLVDGSIPALMSNSLGMISSGSDGTWGSIAPNEVLLDYRSPEINEETFLRLVVHLGCKVPNS